MPVTPGGVRTHTRAQQKSEAEFKASCKAADLPCWMDGMPIDYEAAWDDFDNDDRFQLDHYYPVSTHPELQDDPANYRPSHAGCNLQRSNKAPAAGLGTLSREWT